MNALIMLILKFILNVLVAILAIIYQKIGNLMKIIINARNVQCKDVFPVKEMNIYSNICFKCEDGLNPIIDDNAIIISCYSTCEIGKYDKSKSCSNVTDECGEYHEGFQLKEGNCVSIFHIYAKYKYIYKNESVNLFKPISISKLLIDGNIINCHELFSHR